MRFNKLRYIAMFCAPLFGACAQEAAPPSGPDVEITVAPLTLPGVAGVSYAVAVFNADPSDHTLIFNADGTVAGTYQTNLVWQESDLTSNQYGNGPGGALSYVGPCDASNTNNWVALALNAVDVGNTKGSYSGTTFFPGTDNLLDDQNSAFLTTPNGSNDGDADFANPAPYDDALVMMVPCIENTDSRAVFNLTVMRDANQGFFDIAVNFEDIFCSMKIDTCYAGEGGGDDVPIKLLFGDEPNEGRVETAVIGSACSAGPGDAGDDSTMWMAPLQVSCDGGEVTFSLDPTGGSSGSDDGEAGNQPCASATTGGTAGTRATGTATFLYNGLNSGPGPIAAGTECAPWYGSYGPHFTLDEAATPAGDGSSSTTVNITAVDLGAQAGSSNGRVDCFDAGGAVIGTYYETALNVSGGSDPGAGADYTLCYALYWGHEDLECDPNSGDSCNKKYWNVAINIDDLRDQGLSNCTVETAITASSSDATFVNGQLRGPGQTYGYTQFSAELTDDSAEPTCFQGPMGSTYASIEYGTTPDLIGGGAFPKLCSNYRQGGASPNPLAAQSYFQDLHVSASEGLYEGRVGDQGNADGSRTITPVVSHYAGMGNLVAPECESDVRNMIEYRCFTIDSRAAGDQVSLSVFGVGGSYDFSYYYQEDDGSWRALEYEDSTVNQGDNTWSFDRTFFGPEGATQYCVGAEASDDTMSRDVFVTATIVEGGT